MISLISKQCIGRINIKRYTVGSVNNPQSNKFETVFAFPFVKYIAALNRLKIYHGIGASLGISGSGVLEMLSIVPEHTFLAASYVGITGGIVLSLASLPFRNIIGYLYISEDNNYVKISSVDYWGKRNDKIIPTDNWVPLMDMTPSILDALYLSPKLTDGSNYKLFVKFGKVINARKMGQVLE